MSINRFSFALNAPANERYLVRKGVDMLALLRALAARRQAVALSFGEAEDVLQTQLLGINPAYDELFFAPGNDDAGLERLLTAGTFGVETMLDSIRIVFIATNAEATQFKGAKALRGHIPDVLARMQRRESVRIATPKDRLSFCVVRVGADPVQELRMPVVDISVGGLGLSLSAAEAAIAAGKTFHECSLELPDIGVMRCTLNIVYVQEPLAGGSERRIGCHFVDLPGLSREQLRSYVARLERAQLAAG